MTLPIPFVLSYNKCVLIQTTFFFKVGQLTHLLPLGRGSRRNSRGLSWHPSKQCTYTSNEQLWSRGCPLHKSFHSHRDHKLAAGGLVRVGSVLRGWGWVGVGKQVSTETVGGLIEVCVSVSLFFSLCISCACKLQHPWASWKWLQTPFFFAKAVYVMAICLFGVWALSHAVSRCRGCRVGTTI